MLYQLFHRVCQNIRSKTHRIMCNFLPMQGRRFCIFSMLLVIIAGVVFSQSRNPLSNTTWQEENGAKVVFGEQNFRFYDTSGGLQVTGTYRVEGETVYISNSTFPGSGTLFGDVLSLTFIIGGWLPASGEYRRVQSNSQSSNQNISSIRIMNNTGYSCDALWIRRAGSSDWGNMINIENNLLRSGQTSNVRLSFSLNTANRYDIALRDTDGDFYIKTNIQITSNSLITFIFDDYNP